MSTIQYTPPEQTARLDPMPTDQHNSVKGRTHAVSDANRLQYELEGGGAPSQRLPMSERTPLARFGHWLFRRLTRS